MKLKQLLLQDHLRLEVGQNRPIQLLNSSILERIKEIGRVRQTYKLSILLINLAAVHCFRLISVSEGE